jgi:hypothetical protein
MHCTLCTAKKPAFQNESLGTRTKIPNTIPAGFGNPAGFVLIKPTFKTGLPGGLFDFVPNVKFIRYGCPGTLDIGN